MDPKERYYELAEKWINGTISEEEKKEFQQWFGSEQEEPLEIPSDFAQNEEELRQRMWNRIQDKKKARIFSLSTPAVYRLAAACLIALCCGVGYLLLRPSKNSMSLAEGSISKVATTVQPGSSKAFLTLSDGSRVELDSSKNGVITLSGNSRVVQQQEGSLAYEPLKKDETEITYNTLTTPKGGQYQITLADETKVWLNSASSLRFPTAFSGSERNVELSGEGYFEVAKNPHMPFKVKVGEMEVKVLGTHFNVMAYEDETAVQTTLLEGSVKVEEKGSQLKIVPGQQVSSNRKGALQLHNGVNIEEVVAWKNGMFQFDQTDLDAILRQIARWYDVAFINEEHIEGHFSGNITKNVSVEKVLHMLELTGAIHFTVKGRQIYVHH